MLPEEAVGEAAISSRAAAHAQVSMRCNRQEEEGAARSESRLPHLPHPHKAAGAIDWVEHPVAARGAALGRAQVCRGVREQAFVQCGQAAVRHALWCTAARLHSCTGRCKEGAAALHMLLCSIAGCCTAAIKQVPCDCCTATSPGTSLTDECDHLIARQQLAAGLGDDAVDQLRDAREHGGALGGPAIMRVCVFCIREGVCLRVLRGLAQLRMRARMGAPSGVKHLCQLHVVVGCSERCCEVRRRLPLPATSRSPQLT